MKNRIILSIATLALLVMIVHKLTGNTRINNDYKWIVPASVIDKDTVPVVNFPVIIINGSN